MRRFRTGWVTGSIVALLLVPACAVAGAQVPAAPRVFELRDVGRATVPLVGDWQFHAGDDPAWAAPDFDDSAWQSIEVGRPWEGQGHPGYTGFGWYRLHLDMPANGAEDWQLALLSPSVQDACEVYWNGELVGRVGKLPPHPSWYPHQQPAGIPLGALRSGVLAIRVWKAPYAFLSFPDEGGLVGVPQAGSREGAVSYTHLDVHKRQDKRRRHRRRAVQSLPWDSHGPQGGC